MAATQKQLSTSLPRSLIGLHLPLRSQTLLGAQENWLTLTQSRGSCLLGRSQQRAERRLFHPQQQLRRQMQKRRISKQLRGL